MRKEQGRKLKERMQKKRDEKTKKLQDELSDLENLEKSRQLAHFDLIAFREEISHRGIHSLDDFKKKI